MVEKYLVTFGKSAPFLDGGPHHFPDHRAGIYVGVVVVCPNGADRIAGCIFPFFQALRDACPFSRIVNTSGESAFAVTDFHVFAEFPARVDGCLTDVIISHDSQFFAGQFFLNAFIQILEETTVNVGKGSIPLFIFFCDQFQLADEGIDLHIRNGHTVVSNAE